MKTAQHQGYIEEVEIRDGSMKTVLDKTTNNSSL
jgi:hypothetical protein